MNDAQRPPIISPHARKLLMEAAAKGYAANVTTLEFAAYSVGDATELVRAGLADAVAIYPTMAGRELARKYQGGD